MSSALKMLSRLQHSVTAIDCIALTVSHSYMKPFQSKILQIPCKGLVVIFFQGRKPKKSGGKWVRTGGGGGTFFALSKGTVQTPT